MIWLLIFLTSLISGGTSVWAYCYEWPEPVFWLTFVISVVCLIILCIRFHVLGSLVDLLADIGELIFHIFD